MWCLVNLPNGTTFGVKCDPKKNSQECLEKVCQDLGIICETDYFGLIPVRDETDEDISGKQWINLRNPLGRHGNDRGPIMLSLRVKFWVPAHLILQETVRNIFFIQARQELLDGHLNAANWTDAAKLSALLIQADGVKFGSTSNYLQKENANVADIQSRRPTKRKCSENDINSVNVTSNKSTSTSNNIYQDYIVKPNDNFSEPMPENYIQMIAKEHEKLSSFLKMAPSSAKYWLLEEISNLEGYGEEIFEGVVHGDPAFKCKVGVNPHGIALYKAEEKQSIPFTAIESAKSIRKSLRLTYINENHESTNLELKLSCGRSAAALYRAITEKHAFYSCETVRSVVTAQFIRDLKGTIISMFNEDTELGKRYVFDIQRTCREVYDNSRRILHARGIEINNVQQETSHHDLDKMIEEQAEEKNQMNKMVDHKIMEALTCRICMDNEIDSMFSPCGHVTSCKVCAEKCDRCPLCRANIASVNKIFLPTELRDRPAVSV